MNVTLPCCRLARNTSCGSRAAYSLTKSRRYSRLSPPRPSVTRSVVAHSRRFLTLPDLSKLSPFGSIGSGGGKDDCETYQESVVMPFPKDLLFDIVSDVDKYESFVPYCVQSKVDHTSEKQVDNQTREFLAELAIGYGQFRESYTSKVTIIKGKSVRATAIPTPLFKRLETIWVFESQSDHSTKVDFQIHYSFTNPLYAAFAKTAIEKMTTRMVDAFKQRAEEQQHVKG